MTYQDLQALASATDEALDSLAGPSPLQQRAAQALRALSRLFDSMALRLSFTPAATKPGQAVLEFHADAGAPEGALYVNGQLVGHVMGVKRL
jgi:hypothetical protein